MATPLRTFADERADLVAAVEGNAKTLPTRVLGSSLTARRVQCVRQ